MELNFKIQNDRLIAGSVLEGNSGNRGTYVCKFDIIQDEEHLWFCVFKSGDVTYSERILSRKCTIPQEVLEASGEILIGCYGLCDNYRISTNWLSFLVKEGAYCEDHAPSEPTPDMWEELVMNSVPYIGESKNWYVYDKKKKEYVDSGVSSKGEKGDKGEAGYSNAKYFPVDPQIDITITEEVRYVDIEKMPTTGTALANYKFTCANVLITNVPQSEAKSTDFQTKINKSELYLSAPTSFLYNERQQYWAGYFDLVNNLALGQNIAVTNKTWKAQALMPTNWELFSLIKNISAFRFKSVSQNIPVGTNIKIWLK